jgi:hypothetical protein
VKAIARACWEIFLLRSGPQAFPRSWLLLGMLALAYFITDAMLALVQGYGTLPLLLQTSFDTGLQVVIFAVLLATKSVLPRLVQTLSAWYGAASLMNILSLPVAVADRLLPEHAAQVYLALPFLLLLAWTMMVMAHVLRHALGIGLAFGLIIAAVCTLANQVILQSLFPLN